MALLLFFFKEIIYLFIQVISRKQFGKSCFFGIAGEESLVNRIIFAAKMIHPLTCDIAQWIRLAGPDGVKS